MPKDPFFQTEDLQQKSQTAWAEKVVSQTPQEKVVPITTVSAEVQKSTETIVKNVQNVEKKIIPESQSSPVIEQKETSISEIEATTENNPEEILEQKLNQVEQKTPPIKKVNAPQNSNRQRSGSRLSFRWVMIGCLLFLLLIVWGLSFVFYSMLADPSQQRTIIPRQAAQDLLITFAWVFFVVIFFVGVFFFTVNITRLLSKKRSKKLVYSFGAFIWFLLMLLAVWLGIPTVTSISQAGESKIDRIVDPYVLLPDGATYAASEPRVLLIAPTKIFYQLNSDIYKSRVLLPLGSPDVTWLTLSCWNGQEIGYDSETNGFGSCLYTEKKIYPVTLNLQYVDRQTGEIKQDTRKLADLSMDAKIDFDIVDGELTTNDKADEVLLGEAPVKLRLDAQDIVTAFGLTSNEINWDIDGDGEYESLQTAIIKQQFLRSQLYTIRYQIPWLSPYVYSIQARVLQPETPVCQVNIIQQSDSVYRFDVKFVEWSEKISQYAFAIKDLANGSVIDQKKVRWNSLQYDFLQWGDYAVKAAFITQDGKTSSCESDDFMVGDVAYEVDYDLTIKSPTDQKFLAINESRVTVSEEWISVKELPTTLRFTDIEVFPRTTETSTTMLLDGQAVLANADGGYDVIIATQWEHMIQIQSTNQESGQSTIVETIAVDTDLQWVIGKLLVRPDTVGTEPFEVEFDASTTKINDPDDEVVYFTWDFWDGEVKQNINQAIIKHTYYFDEDSADGRYNPQLTITTKKWRELVVDLDNPIIVKRSLRDARISIDSHPGQIAKTGEFVKFSLTADGVPSRVTWTFGPDDTLECAARECTEASRTFTEAWEYTIQIKVEYEDHPDVLDEVELIIQ